MVSFLFFNALTNLLYIGVKLPKFCSKSRFLVTLASFSFNNIDTLYSWL